MKSFDAGKTSKFDRFTSLARTEPRDIAQSKIYMKTLALFLVSIFFPGIGHLIVGKHWKGLLIFTLTMVMAYFFPLSAIVFVIIALVDLYYIMEKEDGRKAASRRLIFSLLIALIIIPGLFLAFGTSLIFSSEYAEDHYFNEKNTISEMDAIVEALESYRNTNGAYPEDYDAFINSKPIWKNWRSDSWNNPYQYDITDSTCCRLTSAGEDQQHETEDDLIERCKN